MTNSLLEISFAEHQNSVATVESALKKAFQTEMQNQLKKLDPNNYSSFYNGETINVFLDLHKVVDHLEYTQIPLSVRDSVEFYVSVQSWLEELFSKQNMIVNVAVYEKHHELIPQSNWLFTLIFGPKKRIYEEKNDNLYGCRTTLQSFIDLIEMENSAVPKTLRIALKFVYNES